MNAQAEDFADSSGLQAGASHERANVRPFYWSVRRELWETRSIFWAPVVAAAAALAVFFITVVLRLHVPERSADIARQTASMAQAYEFAGFLILFAGVVVGIFYSLEALHGERSDRSILFWKSLPVSDVTAVLAKLSIPMFFIPIFTGILVLPTWLLMLPGTAVLMQGDIAHLPGHLAGMWLVLLYHVLTAHAIWYAPIYGWFLLVSVCSRRIPIVWAFVLPLVVVGIERIAFNTRHFADLLLYRVTGGPGGDLDPNMLHPIAQIHPIQFLSAPGLWRGLALCAIFLALTIRLRRYQEPI